MAFDIKIVAEIARREFGVKLLDEAAVVQFLRQGLAKRSITPEQRLRFLTAVADSEGQRAVARVDGVVHDGSNSIDGPQAAEELFAMRVSLLRCLEWRLSSLREPDVSATCSVILVRARRGANSPTAKRVVLVPTARPPGKKVANFGWAGGKCLGVVVRPAPQGSKSKTLKKKNTFASAFALKPTDAKARHQRLLQLQGRRVKSARTRAAAKHATH